MSSLKISRYPKVFVQDRLNVYFKLVKLADRLVACLYGRTNLPSDVRLLTHKISSVNEIITLLDQYLDHDLASLTEVLQGHLVYGLPVNHYQVPKSIVICRFTTQGFEYRVIGQLKFKPVNCHLARMLMQAELSEYLTQHYFKQT